MPFQEITFFLALFSIASIWIFDKKRVAFFFLALSIFIGLIGSVVSIWGVGAAICYFILCVIYFKYQLPNLPQAGLWFLIMISSFVLGKQMIPGFERWMVIDGELISDNGVPYSMWVSLDKIIAGMSILIFAFKPIKKLSIYKDSLMLSLPAIIIGLSVIASYGLIFGMANIDLKFPDVWLIWIIISLFINCIIEEGIFRFFLQGSISEFISGYKYSSVISILLSSFVFTAFHSPAATGYLVGTLIASLFFGYVFNATKRLEISITFHFLVNVVHFFCFTYPFLN